MKKIVMADTVNGCIEVSSIEDAVSEGAMEISAREFERDLSTMQYGEFYVAELDEDAFARIDEKYGIN